MIYSTITITLNGTSSHIQGNFHPTLFLDEHTEYECALVDLIIHNIADIDKITALGVLHIQCDITTGSYINNGRSHVIHQFAACTSHIKDQTLAEIPQHLIYFPLKTKSLYSVNISLVDSKGQLVDIDGGTISCRLNIKRYNNDQFV